MLKPIHVNYARLTPEGTTIVDDAFNEIHKFLVLDKHIIAQGDDRAERLVEAIATYVIDSNPEKYNLLVAKEPA